ncbi:uncharacterized protein LOC122257930 [Penaeus japonicus]|uniref:uncharacterized protein LOC122257930 n=1 Tax=Penaeus japonicus TaxID=27405 RepID=UPI001C70C333|nr:uncharacterized protein LOC122257930 [Penaeus japonicus]XP_042879454.1 uncharacterized protein LOC122257930 [Penaeus japonicus]
MMKLRCNGALPGILCLGIVLVILYIAQKYNKTFGRIQEDKVPESGTGLDTTNEKARSFTVIDADTTRESDTGPEFSEKTDKLYRQVESDVYYARQYILAQFRQISNRLTSEDNKQNLADEIESVKHHFRYDFSMVIESCI